MQAEVSARYVSNADLRQLTSFTLDASIPQGFSPLDEMTLKPLSDPLTDSSAVTHFELEATQTLLRDIDLFSVFSLIRGHDPQLAKAELMSALSLRDVPQIVVSPSWWKWLPLIPFNLSVEVK
jgi:hypothetical protein